MFKISSHIRAIAEHLLGVPFQGKAYFVGGLVRDLILNPDFVPLDVDVLIDGDVYEVSHAYAQSTRGELLVHKKFLTATVTHGDGSSVDFVQTRRESYEHPGSLPKVFPGDLASDSARRDFTINTLLVEVSEENILGPVKIIDLHNGLLDLKHRVIKILYEMSFIDDPTRIFRAHRYKKRIDGMFDQKTESLMSEATIAGAATTISSRRVFNELKRIGQEANPEAIMKSLSDAGVLSGIFSFSSDDFSHHYQISRNFFNAMLKGSNKEEFISFLRKASCSKKFIQEVIMQ